MNEREYFRLKAEAEAEYRRKIEAIETVWKMSGGTSSQNGTKASGNGIERGSLQQAVRKALPHLQNEFTVRDVYTRIAVYDSAFAEKIKNKLPSLSSVLKRLEKDKELIVVEVGSGKRPSKYRRAGVELKVTEIK